MRAHIGRSTGICSPPEASSEQRMAILIFTVGDHIGQINWLIYPAIDEASSEQRIVILDFYH